VTCKNQESFALYISEEFCRIKQLKKKYDLHKLNALVANCAKVTLIAATVPCNFLQASYLLLRDAMSPRTTKKMRQRNVIKKLPTTAETALIKGG